MGMRELANDPMMGLATGLLSASGPSTQRVSLGQALGAGLEGYQRAADRADQKRMLEAMKQMQMLQTQLSIQEALRRSSREDRKDARTEELMKLLQGSLGGAPGGSGAPGEGTMPRHQQIGMAGAMAGLGGIDGGTELLKYADLLKPPTVDPVAAARLQHETGISVGQPATPQAPRDISGRPAPVPQLSPQDQAAVDAWKAAGAPGEDKPFEIRPPAPPAFMGNLPPKATQDLQVKAAEKTMDLDADRVKKARAQLEEMSKTLGLMGITDRKLARFMELNELVETGGITDKVPFLPTFDPYKQEMESITQSLAPKQREEGSGSQSDTELRGFLASLPSVANSKEGNQLIRGGFANELEIMKAKVAFAEKYLADKGHLEGLNEAFDKEHGGKFKRGKPLPPNYGANNLTKGEIYETPLGRGRWNGMSFDRVQ